MDLDVEPTAEALPTARGRAEQLPPAAAPGPNPSAASPLAPNLLAPNLLTSNPLAGRPLAGHPLAALLPLSVPRPASAGAGPAEAAPAHLHGSGRHAAHTRPADTGRSAHRRPGEHRAHSHRRDLPDTPHVTGELNWGALALCEAGGDPRAVDPSGRYGGLYQFDARTWRSLGGHGLPQDASAGEQTDRARELYQRRGLEPWPACGPRAAG
ncbi:hypothetical protein GXP74_35910 [Streptacidiphilus sp. P02-A3a]|nr:hypothetical protein GXP74_35910 [Streptacidiphilus sp. P02-A3a]